MRKFDAHNLTGQLGFGLTAAGVISAYCLCLCAVLNQGVFVALVCILFFASVSVKQKFIYAPSPLLAVVYFILLQLNSPVAAAISLTLGGIICFAISKCTKGLKVPDFISGGCLIGLALCATILFTNAYFGIGASGYSPLEMLKSYRSLGFHPDFRGLLYGTITLFTMITYPFKFRKLKDIIPAEFITIVIPFVLNLILNPDPQRTTTNEYTAFNLYDEISAPTDIGIMLYAGFVTGFLLYILTQNSQGGSTNNFITAHPVIPCIPREHKCLAPVVAIIVPMAIILLFPQLIKRLPLPCAGAMLIVSAWQHTSFKPLSATIKEKNILKFLLLILCGTLYIVLPAGLATAVCIALWLSTELFNRRKGAKV